MKKIIVLIGVVSLLLTGCTESEKKTTTPSETPPITSEKQSPQASENTAFTYEKYYKLYTQMAKEFTYPSFKKVADQLESPEVVIVDKGLTFNKRETLTVPGGKVTSNKGESTQNRIVYEDKTNGLVLYLDLIYLRTSLGNDMVAWDSLAPKVLKDYPVLHHVNQNMLSYHNILVKQMLISTTDRPVTDKEMNEVTQHVVKYLSEFKD